MNAVAIWLSIIGGVFFVIADFFASTASNEATKYVEDDCTFLNRNGRKLTKRKYMSGSRIPKSLKRRYFGWSTASILGILPFYLTLFRSSGDYIMIAFVIYAVISILIMWRDMRDAFFG